MEQFRYSIRQVSFVKQPQLLPKGLALLDSSGTYKDKGIFQRGLLKYPFFFRENVPGYKIAGKPELYSGQPSSEKPPRLIPFFVAAARSEYFLLIRTPSLGPVSRNVLRNAAEEEHSEFRNYSILGEPPLFQTLLLKM